MSEPNPTREPNSDRAESPSPGRKRAREEEVFRAAARVFRRRGYHAARIQDVADELGMHKGSLYYYISSKEDLLRGMVEEPLRRMIAAARDILATRHSPEQKLALVVETHLRQFQENKDSWGVFLREDHELLSRGGGCDVRDLAREYQTVWHELLQEGIDSGDFAPDLDQGVVIKAIIGMCDGTYTWFRPEGRYPIQEIARIFADFALHGVRQRAERA